MGVLATLLCAALVAAASPVSPRQLGVTLGDAAAQCGNHQQISCCIKGNPDGLLGGNCSPIDLSIIAITVPVSTACNDQVACCTGDHNGLLNLACIVIHL